MFTQYTCNTIKCLNHLCWCLCHFTIVSKSTQLSPPAQSFSWFIFQESQKIVLENSDPNNRQYHYEWLGLLVEILLAEWLAIPYCGTKLWDCFQNSSLLCTFGCICESSTTQQRLSQNDPQLQPLTYAPIFSFMYI